MMPLAQSTTDRPVLQHPPAPAQAEDKRLDSDAMEIIGRLPSDRTRQALRSILGSGTEYRRSNKAALSRVYLTLHRHMGADEVLPWVATMVEGVPNGLREPIYAYMNKINGSTVHGATLLGAQLHTLKGGERALFIEKLQPLLDAGAAPERLTTCVGMGPFDFRWACLKRLLERRSPSGAALGTWLQVWADLGDLQSCRRFDAQMQQVFKGADAEADLLAFVQLTPQQRAAAQGRAAVADFALTGGLLGHALQLDDAAWRACCQAQRCLGRTPTSPEIDASGALFADLGEDAAVRLVAAIRAVVPGDAAAALRQAAALRPEVPLESLIGALHTHADALEPGCKLWCAALEDVSPGDRDFIMPMVASLTQPAWDGGGRGLAQGELMWLPVALAAEPANLRAERMTGLRDRKRLELLVPGAKAEPLAFFGLLQAAVVLHAPADATSIGLLQTFPRDAMQAMCNAIQERHNSLAWDDASAALAILEGEPATNRVLLARATVLAVHGPAAKALTRRNAVDNLQYLRHANAAALQAFCNEFAQRQAAVASMQQFVWEQRPALALNHWHALQTCSPWALQGWTEQVAQCRPDPLLLNSSNWRLLELGFAAARRLDCIDYVVDHVPEDPNPDAVNLLKFASLMARRQGDDVQRAHAIMPDGHVSALQTAARLWEGTGPLPQYVQDLARDRAQDDINGLMALLEVIDAPADRRARFRLAVLDVATAKRPHRPPPTVPTPFECRVCRETLDGDRAIVFADCSCSTAAGSCCRGCVERAVTEYGRTTCLTGCGAPLSRCDLERLDLLQEQVDARLRALVAPRLAARPNWRWCGTPDCFSGREATTAAAFHCGVCDSTKACGTDKLMVSQLLAGLEASDVAYGTGMVRECYGCGVSTEKDGGCLHMVCPQCRSDWDFVSGAFQGVVFANNGVPAQSYRPLGDGMLAAAGFYEGIPRGPLSGEQQALVVARARAWLAAPSAQSPTPAT